VAIERGSNQSGWVLPRECFVLLKEAPIRLKETIEIETSVVGFKSPHPPFACPRQEKDAKGGLGGIIIDHR